MAELQSRMTDIRVLELRNYLLQPEMTATFSRYFHAHFVSPMARLDGHTLGEFKITGVNDRFVWLRGFTGMRKRLQFLNDFYVNSPVWKKFGKRANEMMINSDNVYLLRPLASRTDSRIFKNKGKFTVVDFYICNSTLGKAIEFFNTRYILFLEALGIRDITLWISEMSENDFPQLPVFQDKNLLVSITNYQDENEYRKKQQLLDESMPEDIKAALQKFITASHKLLLEKLNSQRRYR